MKLYLTINSYGLIRDPDNFRKKWLDFSSLFLLI